jgi:hypothetical protein
MHGNGGLFFFHKFSQSYPKKIRDKTFRFKRLKGILFLMNLYFSTLPVDQENFEEFWADLTESTYETQKVETPNSDLTPPAFSQPGTPPFLTSRFSPHTDIPAPPPEPLPYLYGSKEGPTYSQAFTIPTLGALHPSSASHSRLVISTATPNQRTC